jgi:hypothetical protein
MVLFAAFDAVKYYTLIFVATEALNEAVRVVSESRFPLQRIQ